MGSQKNKRAKRKAYFNSSNPMKRQRTDVKLSPGMKGFLCTCNGNEKGCIKEALNILDDFDAKINPKSTICRDESNYKDDEDIEKALKEEINAEKNPIKKFRPADTGANNCIFIASKVNNVLKLGEAVVEDIKETKIAKSRFLIRLVPVEITCKAYNEDIKKAADAIFDAHFKGEQTSYCIHVNKRSNNNLLRTEVTDDLARLVRDRNINHVVDLKTPAKTVVVEIIRNLCCLAVINNFFGFRKYNLIELASKKTSEDSQNANKSSTGNDIKDISCEPEAPDTSTKQPQAELCLNTELSGNGTDGNKKSPPRSLESEPCENQSGDELLKCEKNQDTIINVDNKTKNTDVL